MIDIKIKEKIKYIIFLFFLLLAILVCLLKYNNTLIIDTKNMKDDLYKRSDDHRYVYINSLTTEDMLWEDMFLKLNNNNNTLVNNMFHALHCVNLMRRMKNEMYNIIDGNNINCKADIDSMHIDHCIKILNNTLFHTEKLHNFDTTIKPKSLRDCF